MGPGTVSQRGTTRKRSSKQAEPGIRVPEPSGEAPAIGHVLRRAREYLDLSLRDVERKIGRSNAYLSQVERGLIRRPDPALLLELADLYGLNFQTLASWAGWTDPKSTSTTDASDSLETQLLKAVLQLDASQRAHLLEYVGELLKQSQT